jgi:diaminopimelate epimerase
MNFTKMQGAGNDFVLVETNDIQRGWSPVATAMCDRRFGVGADGLLLLLPSDVADFKMRIFNPDGSEAEACGNGLRCLVRYVLHRELLADDETQKVSIETVAGIRKATINRAADKPAQIQVGMGTPKFEAKDIPVTIESDRGLVDIKSMMSYTITIGKVELPLNLVSMGNPHAVYFCQQPVADFPLAQLGPKVEQHKIFPNRVNFQVARLINRKLIEARVWERGAGETLACGTGACAVAVAARLRNLIDDKANIGLPGGILGVEWDGVGEVFLGGPAEVVFTGEWREEVSMR